MENYYEKYIKYKKKYITLKKQVGGDCNQLVLLSEACNTTKMIFYSKEEKYNDIINKVNKTLDASILRTNKYISSIGFNQDPLIQYYNLKTNRYLNYLNKIGENGSLEIMFDRPFSIFPRELKPKVIKYVENFNKKYKSKLENLILTKEYNQIEIDMIEKEARDSIPSNEKKINEKILFINNYAVYNFLFPDTKFLLPFINIENDDSSYKTFYEYEKGGNFISSPPTNKAKYGAVFYLNDITLKTLQFINDNLCQPSVKLTCSFTFKTPLGDNFRHIDELMTFMPYGHNTFKIWFYGEGGLTPIQKEERIRNLNKICNILYGSDFTSNKDKFVFFDLELNRENKFIIPPVMNRLLIETDTKIYGFFSETQHDRIVNDEWEKINSFSGVIKDKCIKFIDTTVSNNDLGNLHCLIKNTLNYTTKFT